MSRVPIAGVNLIKQFEGCHLEAYPDPLSGGKPYTVGWGSTRKKDGSSFYLGERITQAQADDLLMWQLEQSYLPPLERIPGWSTFNDNQRGALLSFAYNLGAHFYGSSGFETISRVLREQRWDQIESAFLLYRNPGSSVEAGLKRRRLAEANLFLTPAGQSVDQSVSDSAGSSGGSTAPSNYRLGDRLLYLTEPYFQGGDVEALQQALKRVGAGVVIDGVFGPATKLAVERFQSANRLVADGVVGAQTVALLSQRVLYLTQPPMTGGDVRVVQQALIKAGITVTTDGIFGPGLKAAVEYFQAQSGLTVDGVVGPKTLRILQARPLLLANPYLQGEDVRQVQLALQKAGITVGIDGIFGPGTKQAVATFQKRQGLVADGVVGPRTLVKLGV